MKNPAFAMMVVLTLVACSPPEAQKAKEPAIIDKAQIDVAKMNLFVKPPSRTTNWACFLLPLPKPEDELARWKQFETMTHRPVQFTDGPEVLATGQIAGTLMQQDKYVGLSVTLPSPTAAEDLESKLGIRRPEPPPSRP
jgi:hypothetical protein